MDAVRWARVSQQLDALLDLDLPGRESELVALAAHDPTLAQELRRLLALGAAREDFLAEPLRPSGRDDDGDGKAPRAGERVGAYTLLRVLGEGGMGQVWLAARADGLYQRKVALKLLRPGLAAPRLRQRFDRERGSWRASHPNIARLLDAGIEPTADPTSRWNTSRANRSPTTAAAAPLDIAARLDLFLQVCEAVSHAHANLIVHRDLKPSTSWSPGRARCACSTSASPSCSTEAATGEH
jgi:serine/threonine-protein kinase